MSGAIAVDIECIYLGLERLMINGWLPRMEIVPLVTWRKRSCNTLVDALANLSMDYKRDFVFISEELSTQRELNGSVLQ